MLTWREISYCGGNRPKRMSYRHCLGKRLKSGRTFQTSNLQVFRAICEIRRRLANEWRRFWDAFTFSLGDCGKTPHVKTNIKNLSRNDVPWRFLSRRNGLCWSQSISFPIPRPCKQHYYNSQLSYQSSSAAHPMQVFESLSGLRGSPWDWQRVIHHRPPFSTPKLHQEGHSTLWCYSLWGHPKELAAARCTTRWTVGHWRTKAKEGETGLCNHKRNS